MNQSDTRTLDSSDIVIGKPLTWPVYDKYGHLLLRKGYVIASDSQLAQLLARGAHRDIKDETCDSGRQQGRSDPVQDRGTIFEWLELFQERMRRLYRRIWSDPSPDIPQRLVQLCLELQRMCAKAPDALLAALQLNQEGDYSLLHPLHAAVLCELLATRLGISEKSRLHLIVGALTHDIGILDIQSSLHKQSAPLTDVQWAKVQAHPAKGVELLRGCSITDQTWLDVVMHHHERVDGSGYPHKLDGSAIHPPARILSISDIYSAMIRPREYRDAVLAKDVLKELFMERGEKIDDKLVQLFIKEMGVFPPGAFVKLKNGEVAVVTSRSDESTYPHVRSILAPRGTPFTVTLERNTHQDEFSVIGMIYRTSRDCVSTNLNRIWPTIEFSSIKRGLDELTNESLLSRAVTASDA